MKKIAIITGATGGLGQEFVRAVLKEKPVEVWAIARNADKLNALQSKFGRRVRPVVCDLSKRDDIERIAQLLESERPDVRLLINNAGIARMGSTADFSDDEISKLIDINCKAVSLLCGYVLPFMSKGSRILNISSASSFQPVPYINLYAASKAFVRSYSRALNVELKSRGITCTAVCPGWIDTEMLPEVSGGKAIKYPGLVSPKRVAVQAMRDSEKGRDMSVCTLFVKYEHFLSKTLAHKTLMKMWVKGVKGYIA